MTSDNTRKKKDNSILLENNSGQMPIKVPIKDKTSTILLVDKVVDENGDTISIKADVYQD